MNLKILDLNCWLLPPPFSSENGERLEKIVNLIKKHDPDAITLQEVWLKKYEKEVRNELPEYNFFSSGSRIFNRSGLLMGLKDEPLSFSMHYFPTGQDHSFHERLGKKGFQIAQIQPGFYLVNTQLYAPEKKGDEKITLSQFRTIESMIKDKKAILSGDLNLHDRNFPEINESFSYDPPGKFTVAAKNRYANMKFNLPHHADHTVDYIVGTQSTPEVQTRVVNPVQVSDHYALIGIAKI